MAPGGCLRARSLEGVTSTGGVRELEFTLLDAAADRSMASAAAAATAPAAAAAASEGAFGAKPAGIGWSASGFETPSEDCDCDVSFFASSAATDNHGRNRANLSVSLRSAADVLAVASHPWTASFPSSPVTAAAEDVCSFVDVVARLVSDWGCAGMMSLGRLLAGSVEVSVSFSFDVVKDSEL